MKFLIFWLFIKSHLSFSQKLEVIAELPQQINESSGLIFYNDTTIATINDSGGKASIYFLNLQGKLINEIEVTNATNVDWEELAIDDKKNIYVGDFGNNNNNRTNLVIYKTSIDNFIFQKKTIAERIEIKYKEQVFPTPDSLALFDAEAFSYYNDSLWLFTKCHNTPFTGLTYCYKIPTTAGSYEISKSFELILGENGLFKDAITGSSICGEKLYLNTYNRLIQYAIHSNYIHYQQEYSTNPFSQKEAVCTIDNSAIYFTDEYQKFIGGRKIYKMILQK